MIIVRRVARAVLAVWRALEDDHNAKMYAAPITSEDANLWETFQ
jgi:hypothetical protein